jgi:hypothetical protein
MERGVAQLFKLGYPLQHHKMKIPHFSLITALAILEASCGACSPTTTPPAPPIVGVGDAAEDVPPASIYAELVEAGCLAPDDAGAGVLAVVDLEFSDAAPPWITCLAAGGSVGSCNPCPQ